MVDGRSYEDWQRTAAVMALIANVNRDPKKARPFKISDFHPMMQGKKAGGGVEQLKEVVGGKGS